MRLLVNHWRGKGIKIAVFLDDRTGANNNFDCCLEHARQVKMDLESAFFITDTEKSIRNPCQGFVWLGLFLELSKRLS